MANCYELTGAKKIACIKRQGSVPSVTVKRKTKKSDVVTAKNNSLSERATLSISETIAKKRKAPKKVKEISVKKALRQNKRAKRKITRKITGPRWNAKWN
ncbi:hypothetical protein N9P25_01915 [Flavobacteriaceae bacterium]|nr:hypothetical protein [Flavobacteriaceae bacterium]